MEEEKKEGANIETKPGVPVKTPDFTEKARTNPWMVSTIILGVLVIILLITTFSGGTTGKVISKETAAGDLMSYLNTNISPNITLINVSEQSGMYMVTVGYQGQAIPVYMTKDGTHYTTALVPMITSNTNANTNTQTQQQPPKSDVPNVELFVMSYCPYGTQMEKAIIPALQLLGNQVNFTLRFVDYSMHGQKEVDENVVQYCIQKDQNPKFLNYLSCFLQAGDEKSCLTSTGIDQTALNSCVLSTDSQFNITKTADATIASGSYPPFPIDQALNQQYGVQGSPTLVINGVQVEPSTRSPEALKGTICTAFNTVPTQCSQKLDTTSTSPGFGTSTTTASTSASCATTPATTTTTG